jgi:hypothetical protein
MQTVNAKNNQPWRKKMNTKAFLDNRLSTIIYALLLIWWGLRWSVLQALPEGSGLLVTGIILLGANAVRKLVRLPAVSNSMFFGLLSLLSGGALVIISVLQVPIEPPVLETIMIVLGVLLLGYALLGTRKKITSEA